MDRHAPARRLPEAWGVLRSDPSSRSKNCCVIAVLSAVVAYLWEFDTVLYLVTLPLSPCPILAVLSFWGYLRRSPLRGSFGFMLDCWQDKQLRLPAMGRPNLLYLGQLDVGGGVFAAFGE